MSMLRGWRRAVDEAVVGGLALVCIVWVCLMAYGLSFYKDPPEAPKPDACCCCCK